MMHGELTNLRAIERTDTGLLRTILNDATVQAGWGTLGVPVSLHLAEQQIEEWLEAERILRRPAALIIESLEGDPVGVIVLVTADRIQQSMVTLSIAVLPDYQRQGFGRDALATVVDALHNEWNVHRIQLFSEAGNTAARALYASLGFVLEATKRDATYSSGVWHDQLVWSLLPEDVP
ncbi:MAG TPA: GNAT family protein [Thermomicrobiales bacterium]|nr:GNAT family protein [Thermomicrobiales bacterium]HRA47536.1 GNAT family protein [Thermomicrobiales bacterium]